MATKHFPIVNLVVHCSATRPKTFVDRSVIDRMHRERGFLKIGYHYVILRDGTVQKGRKDSEVGAHVAGHNTGTLGICLVGGLNDNTGKPENNFTDEQFASLSALLFKLTLEHPTAKVVGHRDLSPDLNKDGIIQKSEWLKDCPCFDVGIWWSTQEKQ
jgi:N-acetylmuramoyl-L-alanine amidase